MEISSAVKTMDVALNQNLQKSSLNSGEASEVVRKQDGSKDYQVSGNKGNKEKQMDRETAEELNDTMNKFMQMLNADIRFSMHERTGRLIVQVVDTKEDKVLKEFPPHELLDTIANIREYVGILLDKKA